ncbi:MAG: ABC transporter ATP-binding protein [Ignavibacteria bacterium]|nr:ABC transporter ATP-binding protein [Ignavibacteria bacterium]
MSEITLEAVNLTKKFDRKMIFKSVNFRLSRGSSTAITGRNGSGKSTLIKIIANLLLQTSGSINLHINGSAVKKELLFMQMGFVSPYLNLYDEFSGYENLKLVANIRGRGHDNIENVLKRVGLFERRNDMLKIYSSGMKQRLKIAFSILHTPDILLLDEPTSNLDTEGIGVVDDIAAEYSKDRILVIATNDEHEKSLCSSEINLNKNA